MNGDKHMTYKNHRFTIYNVDSGTVFQVEGKTNFIEWINTYAHKGIFKYFTTYNKFKEFEAKYDFDIDRLHSSEGDMQ